MTVRKEVCVSVDINPSDVLDDMSEEHIIRVLGEKLNLGLEEPAQQIIFMMEKLGTEEYKEVYDHIVESYHYDVFVKNGWVKECEEH